MPIIIENFIFIELVYWILLSLNAHTGSRPIGYGFPEYIFSVAFGFGFNENLVTALKSNWSVTPTRQLFI